MSGGLTRAEVRATRWRGCFAYVKCEHRYAGKQVTRKRWIIIFSIVSFHCTCAKNISLWWNSNTFLLLMKYWTFICRRASVCRLSVCRLSSVTFGHPTQPIETFGNVSAPFNTLVTWRHSGKILRRSSQGNPSVGGLNQRMLEKCSDFGPFRGYISETVQDRR